MLPPGIVSPPAAFLAEALVRCRPRRAPGNRGAGTDGRARRRRGKLGVDDGLAGGTGHAGHQGPHARDERIVGVPGRYARADGQVNQVPDEPGRPEQTLDHGVEGELDVRQRPDRIAERRRQGLAEVDALLMAC